MRWILVLTAIAAVFLSAGSQSTFAAAGQTAGGQADVQFALADLRKPVYKVAVKELYLEDSKRQKTLEIRLTYPVGSGPFPIVIFSHGMFGSRDSYTYLVQYWARHGYFCIQPSHDDSLKCL